MKRTVIALFVAGVSLVRANSVAAGPITVNVGSFSGGTAVIHSPGTLANNLNVILGAVLITGDLGTFESYCVDLQHYDLPGANQATVNTMSNWNNTATPVHASLGGGAASWLYDTYGLGAAGDQTKEAALSLAIWNALYDNDFNALSGTGFWVSSLSDSNYGTLANQYLAALQTAMASGLTLPNDLWLQTANVSANYAQDFIARVPEPSLLVFLVMGLSCGVVFLFGRRRSAPTR